MLHVHVLQAQKLHFPREKPQKARIDCFSKSSLTYFYGSFKSNDKTTDPKWDFEFDMDLFRASSLNFVLYCSKILSKDEYLGKVDINMSDLFRQEKGKQLLSNPNTKIQFEFPIQPQDSVLVLTICYSEKVYRPITFTNVQNPIVHLWLTFDPSYEYDGKQNPVELELIQINGQNNSFQNCIYYHLDNHHSWKEIGIRSSEKNVLIGSNYTQIHTIFLFLLCNKYNFFVLKVFNYTGKVTLNFVCENYGKNSFFEGRFYPTPNESSNQIGIIKTVDVQVESNKKYVAPIYLHDSVNANQNFDLTIESINTSNLVIDSSQLPSKYSELVTSEIPFHSQIINKAKEAIPSLNNSNIRRVNVLPQSSEEISLKQILIDLNAATNPKIRLYTGNYNGFSLWYPFFIVYNKNNQQRCKEIESNLLKKPNEFLSTPKSNHSYRFSYNSLVDFELDKIGTDKIIIFNIECKTSAKISSPSVMFAISHFCNGNETLLFQNFVSDDECDSNCCVLLRLEFVGDDWKLYPMLSYYKQRKELESSVASLYANNWRKNNIK